MESRNVVSAPHHKNREPATPVVKPEPAPQETTDADARVRKWMEIQFAYAPGDTKSCAFGDE